jgi:hypothetical protein
MVAEVAGERRLEHAALGTQPTRASCASTLGSRSPAISAASMARPDTPKLAAATTDSLLWASPAACSTRCCSAVRVATRSAR